MQNSPSLKGIATMSPYLNVPEIFGSDVFNEATMKQRLAPEVYGAWKKCIQTGSSLPLDVANEIAEGMKIWATEKGATHYTHWFQPMTGITAEKHDSSLPPVMAKLLWNSQVRSWFGVNPTPVPFPQAVFGQLSKPAAIPHGIPPHLLL